MTEEYWLDDPDHTGYFNREGMINLLKAQGFECIDFYGDTFVDFHLLNPLTNYYEHPETGSMAHKTSVRIENLFHEISMERAVEIYRMLTDMGFGREIVWGGCLENGMNKAKNIYIRLKRYMLFLAQYILYERPRGLDFTMRDTRLYEESGHAFHGYSKTNEKHIRDIFQGLSFEDAKLLDVGCGKGVVLKEATGFPFQKIAGIEIQNELVQTANRNFKILGIDDKIECLQIDAMDFDRYGEFNVFFFFNPFSEEILQKVVDKIIESRGEKSSIITIIYHNPRFLPVFERKMKVMRKEMLHDALKNYDTCILEVCL